MKHTLLLFTTILILSSCTNKGEQQARNSGQDIYFEQSTYDYGQILVDSDGIYMINFKNVGSEAIVINRVRSSCGCTIPTWPKQPIEPGEAGEIEVW